MGATVDLAEARRLAAELMTEHGLKDWRLAFDNARARFGVCRPARREIGLSRHLTLLSSEDEVRNTLLHEIAHALVGPQHGHDEVWRARALAIGCDGTRTDDLPEGAEGPWEGRCSAGHVVHQHRRPTRVRSCSTCTPGEFDPRVILSWTYRGQSAPMLSAYLVELAHIQQRHGLPPDARDGGSAGRGAASGRNVRRHRGRPRLRRHTRHDRATQPHPLRGTHRARLATCPLRPGACSGLTEESLAGRVVGTARLLSR